MQKRNCAWDNRPVPGTFFTGAVFKWCLALGLAGCATPEYAIRATPVPEESAEALEIERTISAVQAEEFTKQGARPIGASERVSGFMVQRVVDRLSRVTERPSLRYRTYLYRDADPNAAALADGRIYLSTGLLEYLKGRGGREDELAFILGHEIGHTVAQHLVRRYRQLARQELLIALASAGVSAATRNAGARGQELGQLVLEGAQLARSVVNSNYSQADELEADQLGIQYVMRAGFEPQVALDLLEDFAQFDSPSPFLRTHPYITERRAQLVRYLSDIGRLPAAPDAAQAGLPAAGGGREEEIRELRQTQRLYPEGSVSWTNLQRQIDALESRR
jgi:predicted Zn-dependent protease